MEMVFTTYISYSNEDRHIANTLYSILKQNQINVWAIDNDHLDGGPSIIKDIRSYMQRSDLILFLMNNTNINSRNVISEYAIAESLGKNIITIIDQSTVIPDEFRNRQYVLLNKNNLRDTINNIINYSFDLKKIKDRNQTFGVLLLLGALALISSKDENKD